MDLYCIGVICSNPGGGTSQYNEGLRLLVLGLRSLDLDLKLITMEIKEIFLRGTETSFALYPCCVLSCLYPCFLFLYYEIFSLSSLCPHPCYHKECLEAEKTLII